MGFADGLGSAFGAGGMGLIFGGIQDRRQLKQQEKLQKLQIEGQKEMADYTNAMAIENWNMSNEYNSAKSQTKRLREAGLNIGLMYGGGGGGGATSPTPPGATGNVSAGSSPGGVGEIAEAMGIVLQNQLQKAQIKNIEADTSKKETETKEVEARTPTHAKGIEKTDAEIQEIASRIGVNAEQVKKLIAEVGLTHAQTSKAYAEINLTNAQRDRIKTLTPLEADNLKTNADLNKALTKQSEEQAKKIKEETSIVFKDYLARAKQANTAELGQMTSQLERDLKEKLTQMGLDQQQAEMYWNIVTSALGLGRLVHEK